MKHSLGLAIPLWFLQPSTDSLERALGEIGPQHLTVSVVTGPGTYIRPRGESPHVVHTRGGWQYPPATASYVDAGLKPPRDSWFGKRNLLSKLVEVAGRYDLPVHARCDISSPSLVDAHPHLAQKTAWGEPLAGGCACPAHPETRALLLDLVRELSDYQIRGLQLVGWEIDRGLPDQDATLRNRPDQRALLGICFCPACQQIARTAGVDPDAAAEETRQLLAEGTSGAVKIPNEGPLADYIAARRAEARTWLQVLVERAGTRPVQHVVGPDQPAQGPTLLDLRQAAAPLDLATWFHDARAVNLPILPPHIPQGDALVRVTRQLLDHGVTWIDMDQVALDPVASTLTVLRQAMRYAQRG